MPYTPTDWVDGVTPVNAANLDKLEAGVADAVAQDEVTVAGTRIVANKLLLADAQPSFRIMGDGKIQWGEGGASSVDTNLYRGGINILKTDGQIMSARSDGGAGFFFNPATAIGFVFESWVGVEVQPRMRVTSTGTISWGPGGASAVDTNLYRWGANILKTDGQIVAARSDGAAGFFFNPATATGFVFESYVGVESNPRMRVTYDGAISWGAGGASALDTNLYRSAANTLKTDDALIVTSSIMSNNSGGGAGFMYNPTTNTGWSLYSYVAADANPLFSATCAGVLAWGAGGASAVDTNLYRSAANTLNTDDVFQAAELVGRPGTTGQVRISDDGTIPRILFGNALDTNLYRSAANVLKTDDSLEVGGSLTLGTNLAVGEMGSGTPAAGKYLDGAGTWTTLPVTTPTTRVVSGTTDTPVIGDANNIIETSSASATTITIPLNSSVAYPIGTSITIIQTGAGQVTVANGGTTLNGSPGLKLNGQWAAATLLKRGTDTWVLFGNLTA